MNSEYIVTADFILTQDGLVSNRLLIVRNGCIYEIAENHSIHPDIKVMDFTGYTVTPYFCDYHLHLFGHDNTDEESLIDDLELYGIAEVYDGGTPDLNGIKMKQSAGNRLSVKTAGCALFKKGTYGHYIGRGVNGIQEAEDLIDKLKHEGADYIKVINSGVYMPETGDISEGGFSLEEISHIAGYAAANGLSVACHANGDKSVRDAVEAGVSTIIHGLRVSEETLSRMSENGVSFVPTLNAFIGLKRISKKKEAIMNIEEDLRQHFITVKRASDKGVKVLPGSDAGASFLPYGLSYSEELSLFRKAGISIEKILMSAVKAPFKNGDKAAFLVLNGMDIEKTHSWNYS